ncbi:MULTISPECIES: site-specific integrase [unclassified Bradyrhizobium]|uniref:site-specific integrase n=1 Tax=unclassified Bradyrhizobium TaxID=2631580 RepID=UPI0015C8681E|nr:MULTISPECIES: site-specific integrase [unclassified Bradyrhizobium]MBB4261400.1 integrase [Bradyrhizobium sp. CIR3A]NYG46532.1 integrase [Bradyrhizobium sp. IAR9]
MAALTYMQRRASGTYEFRRRLPEALAGKPVPSHMRDAFPDLVNQKTRCFKRELVRSLGTKELKQAKRRDHQEALKATQLFDAAMEALTPSTVTEQPVKFDLKQLGEGVFAALLAEDEVERTEGDDRRHLQTSEQRAEWPDLVAVPPSTQMGMSADHAHMYGELLPVFEDEFRAAYARRDPKIVYPETNVALKARGIYLSKSSPEFQKAALVVLEAHVRAYDAMRKRQRGEIIPTPIVAEPSTDERGPKLSEALASWAAGGSAHNTKKPNANTVTEAEQAIRYFKELHGDLRLGEITREKAREFRDAVAMVPAALPRDFRRLPLPELLKRDLSGFKPREATTVNKIVQVLGGIISRAEREGFLDKVTGFVNPFGKAIRLSVDNHQTRRKHFEKLDLKTIFASPVYANNDRPTGGGGEAAFWFPLIGLLSGMRLDEIAQLRICDLRKDEDTKRWYFDIDRTGGRSTKTNSSIRHVPLHRELKRIGLLKYREALLKQGASLESPLWPEVNAEGERTRSSAWSKWFGRYLRSTCGVADTAKVFHSFRHTFKRMTRDAGIPEEMHDALTGHSSGGVGRSYGKGFSLKPLAKAIDEVQAPTDLRQLSWSRPNAARA